MRKNKRLQMQRRHVAKAALHDDVAFDTDGNAHCPACLSPMRPVSVNALFGAFSPDDKDDIFFIVWSCPECHLEVATETP